MRTTTKAVLALTILQNRLELLIRCIYWEFIFELSGHVLDALIGVIKTSKSFVSIKLIHRIEL